MTIQDGEKTGVLLVNTGSPAAPGVAETRAYLRRFLSDPRIIDTAAWKRWLIVHCFILPFRPKRTAAAYRAIWTERGSPLIAFSEDLRKALAARLPDLPIALGMAYGEPGVEDALDGLIDQNVDRIVVVPMFPQYASATTGSVSEAVYRSAARRWNVPALSIMPPFHRDAGFLDAWQAVAGPALETFRPDHVLLSFHGLPERHIYKGDPTGAHCLRREDCCDVSVSANHRCYRHHCMETARALAERLKLEAKRYTITFQSRLGREPWLGPATDRTLVKLAQSGVKRLAVLSPSFVTDCLETLEEIGITGRATFLEHGGRDFLLVPSLNAHSRWVDALARLIVRW